MTLMEFSMIPLDKGASLSAYVTRVVSIVDGSGLDYRLNAMGTVVEGEWDDLMALLTKCYREMEKDSDRISLQVKIDSRKGAINAIEQKVQKVKSRSGRNLKV